MKNSQRLTKNLIKLVLPAMLLLSTQHALAHGYLDGDLSSRARLCQTGVNTNCGGAQYEPQSTGETFQGFPAGSGGSAGQGPKDGQIASGGNSLFSALDAQTETRWHKTEITDPNIVFVWKYLAPHPVDFHQYFITKDGWDHNKPLTRASFESTPFCQFPGSGVMPIPDTKHACVIPPGKKGHHVILGIWGVRDTKMAFHDPVDVDINTQPGSPSGWKNVGSIRPSVSLLPGDTVKARAFNSNGEAFNYSTEITIASQAEGQQTEWPYVLAQKINNTQTLVAAGIRDANDVITPVRGPNEIYAKPASAVTHFEIQVKIQDDPSVRMAISAMPADTPLTAGKAKMRIPVLTTHPMAVQLTLYDASNNSVGTITTKVPSGSSWLELDITTNPGPHKLVMTGTTEDGRTSRQDEQSANVTGTGGAPTYDYKFPDQLKSYQAGTRVLATDGNVYECKPFPYSGYCTQWAPTATSYEPGTGSHWQDAWIRK
ncbi:N-acetylglucosamine-binding protein GbpA [Pseudomonas sp. Marseille-Q1929]|uniref:N-acetylglucosamine-binding protein GbpA n=1 Tax=Pseudomonas sp. Marseille-Q1929 TaxID=2730402 RepID=UPI001A8E88A0|nr:N-acetylglucosamine-binding protein GbpA [Pseudomonas sp. Marseille-Q1929]MBO0496506.1 N-acetylglucosamine-binding protein GbpA [Pseudomonas sp. Marseille-Q1929]